MHEADDSRQPRRRVIASATGRALRKWQSATDRGTSSASVLAVAHAVAAAAYGAVSAAWAAVE
jgi:hypothetical protein